MTPATQTLQLLKKRKIFFYVKSKEFALQVWFLKACDPFRA
jgi:hypothetical protein